MVNSELLETVGSRDGGVREDQQGQDMIRQIYGQKVHKQIIKGLWHPCVVFCQSIPQLFLSEKNSLKRAWTSEIFGSFFLQVGRLNWRLWGNMAFN